MKEKNIADIALRMVCDFLLLSTSYALALLGQYFWEATFSVAGVPLENLFEQTGFLYLKTVLPLIILSMTVFWFSGFYTRGRSYQSRYKALVIFQAVSLSYLLFAVFLYLTPLAHSYPKSVLFIGYGVTGLVIGSARLWSTLWRRFAKAPKSHQDTHAIDQDLILVIGGAGYIGSALLPKLIKAGYKIRVLDLFLYGKEAIRPFLNHPKVEIIQADFRQIDRVVQAVRGVSKVVHLGAIVGDPACSLDEELTIEVNLMATKMIAEICKGHGVERFIFASTCSVYGASDELLDERSKLSPVSLYARSKIACEKVLLSMADENFNPVILRFSTIFGLSGRTRFDLVVNLLTAKAKFEGKITLYGGEQWRPFLHVDDAALSVKTALSAPINQVRSQVFNVGSNQENYTLSQTAELIKLQVPSSEIIDYGLSDDLRNYRVDFSKIERELGYKTTWTLSMGISQVIQAIDQGKVKNYQEPSFNNANYLKGETEFMSSRHMVHVLDMV